ncbi:GAF domain-containing protein [Halorubrum lacusprofundi]|uniref:GAF domain-containing protein n=1 Tax=Halorubrum lacusprofundi TaxID=2247 RepID=UPI000B5A59DA|nr:GAF domain-containing protein [Halorubrum lacusprofundi]MCG1008314.1 response regulator [Halorubrum lacusprofundi]
MTQYTILCVDTEAGVDKISDAIEENDTLRSVVRTSVDGATDVIDTENVDCVVTEYDLPDGTGLSIIETLREQSPNTPCVLYTAVSPAQIDTSSFESGSVEYFNREMPDAHDRLGFVVEDIITHNAQAGFLLPNDEQSRLEALAEYDVDSQPIEESFERLTGLIASHFDSAVAFIGLIDRTTENLVACTGADWDMLAREDSVCTHSMLQDGVMVVEDITDDARFRSNETLHQLGIVSYAGANLTTGVGNTIGQVCVIDHEPRTYSEAEKEDLQEFADIAMEILELRHMIDDTTTETL